MLEIYGSLTKLKTEMITWRKIKEKELKAAKKEKNKQATVAKAERAVNMYKFSRVIPVRKELIK